MRKEARFGFREDPMAPWDETTPIDPRLLIEYEHLENLLPRNCLNCPPSKCSETFGGLKNLYHPLRAYKELSVHYRRHLLR